MKARRSVNGRFTARDLGSGVWRLSTDTPGGPEIHLGGVQAEGAEALSRAAEVEIDWRPDGVLLTLTSAGTERHLRARHAVIHEPATRLYERLPLERFDEAAKEFREALGLDQLHLNLPTVFGVGLASDTTNCPSVSSATLRSGRYSYRL